MTAIEEIVAERRRHEVEGWTAEHDDKHHDGQLAYAAGWYAFNAQSHDYTDMIGVSGSSLEQHFKDRDSWCRWPWGMAWWKPKSRRRDLIRAAALIVAEIDRLDRAGLALAEPEGRG